MSKSAVALETLECEGSNRGTIEERWLNRGDNWLRSGLEPRLVDGCGLGIFTTEFIRRGETVALYGGKVMSEDEFLALPYGLSHYPYQIDDLLFIGPSSPDRVGLGELLNHSCSPSCGFMGEIRLVAIRDINPGEQISIDYATCMSSPLDELTMECHCGAPGCRGLITGADWLLPDVQRRLFGFFQPYLQRKIWERHDRTSLPSPSTPSLSQDLVLTRDKSEPEAVKGPPFWPSSGEGELFVPGIEVQSKVGEVK